MVISMREAGCETTAFDRLLLACDALDQQDRRIAELVQQLAILQRDYDAALQVMVDNDLSMPRVIIAPIKSAARILVLEQQLSSVTAQRDELKLALLTFAEHECDYMRRNNLGDPELQQRVMVARAALSSSPEVKEQQ